MATLRNVDDIVPWALGCPAVRREAAPHQKGEALLLRKHGFPECHQSLSEGLCLLYLPSCLKKNQRYETFPTHTQRSGEHAMKPGRLSPTSSDVRLLPRTTHLSLFFFSFSFAGVFQSKSQTSCHFTSCSSVCIKKTSMPPAIFRTRR